MIALLTNQLFLVCVASSVPCLGLLCHFLSPVVFVVSLYLILFSLLAYCMYIYIYIYIYIYVYIHIPSVSLVLCELLNVMVVCFHVVFWLIVCSSFSMKCLHRDPCLCLGYVRNPRSLMEGTETLYPHATVLNHCCQGLVLGSSA